MTRILISMLMLIVVGCSGQRCQQQDTDPIIRNCLIDVRESERRTVVRFHLESCLKACEEGDFSACCLSAKKYPFSSTDKDSDQQLSLIINWYEKGCLVAYEDRFDGWDECCLSLAGRYKNAGSLVKAKELLEHLCYEDIEYAYACMNLADILYEFEGNLPTARKLYQKACRQGAYGACPGEALERFYRLWEGKETIERRMILQCLKEPDGTEHNVIGDSDSEE